MPVRLLVASPPDWQWLIEQATRLGNIVPATPGLPMPRMNV